ncbi:MAG: helix-turn-helix domain-containing protein [Solirubrobacterales bacterium]
MLSSSALAAPAGRGRREQALANEMRLTILALLGERERRPGELLVELGGTSLSRLEYHLGILERADLIRRDGGRYWRCGGDG